MSVMLATQSKTVAPTPVEAITQLQETGDWLFEMKWDGVRCTAGRVTDGRVRLLNRRGDDITDRFPEVAEAMEAVYDGAFIIDGEIVIFGEDGRPDFNLLAKRKVTSTARALALSKSMPAYFMAFDVLDLDNHPYRHAPYCVRRDVLETLTFNDTVRVTPSMDDGLKLWEFVLEASLEGVVAKHQFAPWVPTRSDRWIKMRRTLSASCIVTGYQEGKGKHEGLVGALYLGVYDPETEELVPCGKVGTGFTDKQREALLTMFNQGVPREVMIAEVEFQEVTPDGSLRFPSYRGLREDLAGHDCTISQLTPQGRTT